MKTIKVIISAFLVFFSLNGIIMANSSKFYNFDISNSAIQIVGQKKIYFGHQSVGFNIMEGVKALAPEINVIVSGKALNEKSYFAHSQVGENRDPDSKIVEFSNNLLENFNDEVDVAFLKFCYADISYDTDAGEIFDKYKVAIDNLSLSLNKTEIIHFTVPLTAIDKSFKSLIKRVFRLPVIGIDDNIKREEFNTLLRKEYGDSGLLFDLAEIESTRLDGSRNSHKKNGVTYYSLVSDFTDDGGHLNSTARKLVAFELINFLSDLFKE